MRRTQARQAELAFAADDGFAIAAQRCHVCGDALTDADLPPGEGQLFVTGSGPSGAIALAYCSVACIRQGGALDHLARRHA